MPPSRKGKGKAAVADSSPSSSPRSSSKRKHSATAYDAAPQSVQLKRSRPSSVIDLSSSPAKGHADVTTPRTPVRKEAGGNISHSKMAVTTAPGTQNMYSFPSRSGPAGKVIDLSASSSPISKPLNGTGRMFGQLGRGGPKRLVVKNANITKKIDPQEFFDRKWNAQSAALESLFQGESAKILLEELYKDAEHICRQGKGPELFQRLQAKCTTHLAESVRPRLVDLCQKENPIDALSEFVHAWRLWQTQLKTIRHIYFYLNQTYLAREHDNGDINTVGMHMFRSEIFNDLNIQEAILPAVVELLQLDRAGNSATFDLLKAAVDTLHDLNVYTNHFEPLLIAASEEYFRSWRKEEAEKLDLPHYVRESSDLYDREMTRCDCLNLDQSTRSQLSRMFDQIFVVENVDRLTDQDSILDMLEGDLDKELEQTWNLLQRKAQQHELSQPFSKYTETDGALIVFDEKREEEMVVRLLAFKKKLDRVHIACFHKDDFMGNTLHKSFEAFMNRSKKLSTNWDTDNAKPGEMIAKHIDLLLKGGISALPKVKTQLAEGEEENDQDFDEDPNDDASIERHLADALDLFRFVHGKAVFEAFYKKDLARRLLMGRTQSFDAERSMLARLRNECGANFTHNLESMFKDMDLAREEMKAYNQLLVDRGTKPPGDIDLAVNVLSVAAWPTYPDIAVNIPTSIAKAQSDFEKHYKDKHVGRKLTWKPSLAHCQVRARFPKGTKELVVSGFQAVVLLLFNDIPGDSSLSYAQIKSATGLSDPELKRTLQSLACARYRVLSKNPRGRDVNETDSFTTNDKFTDNRFRVKINQIQLKETKEENKETHQRVAADRHYETQAAIVRILKARKTIGHNELIVEVIKATRSRGVLDQADIKKNIEKLIEKDYMEREDEVKGYRYLA